MGSGLSVCICVYIYYWGSLKLARPCVVWLEALCMYVCIFVAIHSTVTFLLQLPATILHAVVCILLHAAKMAAACKRLAFSLRKSSNDHYICGTKRKQQYNLPHYQSYTLRNREYERLPQLYRYALQFQDTL